MTTLSRRQSAHGVDELKIQRTGRGGVFGFQVLVVEVHGHVDITGISVAHADGHVVGIHAYVFDHEVGAVS